jgi:hypothetical protein
MSRGIRGLIGVRRKKGSRPDNKKEGKNEGEESKRKRKIKCRKMTSERRP